MIEIIDFLKINSDWVRPIWFSLGILGLLIFYKYTRPSFYKNFTPIMWITTILVYMCIGPLIFCLSLLTLINREKNVL